MVQDPLEPTPPANDATLEERLGLFEIDAADLDRLGCVHDALAGDRDELVAAFYDFLGGVPELARLLPAGEGLERLKRVQARYFETLTGARYDAAYARERTEIGRVHQRIGLQPQWYLAAYRKYVSLALARLARRIGGAEQAFLEAAGSLLKVVSLDTLLALDAYFEQAARAQAAGAAHYRMVFELAPLGIAHADADGTLRHANGRLGELLGCAPEALAGLPLEALVHADEVEETRAALGALLDGSEGAHSAIYRLLRRDGEERWARMSCAVSRGEDGERRILVLMFDDVTEHRHAAHEREHARLALSDSEQRYRALFESSPDAILLVEDGVVVDCNPSCATLLVAPPEALLGTAFVGLLLGHTAPRARDEVAIPLAAALARVAPGRPQRLELELRVGGRSMDVEASFSAVEQSGTTYLQALLRDVSGRRAAEREVRRLNASLEARIEERTAALRVANEELEAFSYTVSHDLRTPLRTIHGFSRLLEEDLGEGLDATCRSHLARVQDAALRMDRMLADLLHLSRVTRAPIRRERVDLSAMAREVVAELGAVDPRPVEADIAPGLAAEADAGLVRNLLENLLSNAWKYGAQRPLLRIAVGERATPRGLAFFVADNGVGFDMAHAGKLFGVFERLHHAHEFPGEGIGLATVRRIVRRHGGDVWAASAPGAGATFYFTLRGGAASAP